MAELDVEPKKKSPIIWIVLIILILAFLFFLLRSCNSTSTTESAGSDTTTTIATTVTSWDSVDFNVPEANYEEVTDKGIEVRGNDKYAIYGLGENILFATDQSAIQNTADAQLQQIASSLKKRYDGSEIAVFGNTDSTGTASHNKELGSERAAAVKNWLVEKAGVAADKISVHSRGESSALATNETTAGRKANRSVQIVVMANTK